MNNLNPDDFEVILDDIKHRIDNVVKCDDIRSIESNFNTKSMMFKSKDGSGREGTIITGEDKGSIAIDIDTFDGNTRSFILKDKDDSQGIQNISGWFEENYSSY
jgi:hypothetical protein